MKSYERSMERCWEKNPIKSQVFLVHFADLFCEKIYGKRRRSWVAAAPKASHRGSPGLIEMRRLASSDVLMVM
jgi:hypothetical protein